MDEGPPLKMLLNWFSRKSSAFEPKLYPRNSNKNVAEMCIYICVFCLVGISYDRFFMTLVYLFYFHGYEVDDVSACVNVG